MDKAITRDDFDNAVINVARKMRDKVLEMDDKNVEGALNMMMSGIVFGSMLRTELFEEE